MDRIFSFGTLGEYWKRPAIAKTESAKEELSRLGVKEVTVCTPGLDFSVMHDAYKDADRRVLRKAWDLPENDTLILTVSRLEPDKRPLDLLWILKKAQEHTPCHLVLVGKGCQEEDIENRAKELGVSENLTIIDEVPYEKMWELYRASDFYVNVSRNEIFGMAVMEAIYYEVPVLASPALGPSMILRDMPGHRLCGEDKDIVSRLAGTKPPKKALMESHRRLTERFSWDVCADKFVEIAIKRT